MGHAVPVWIWLPGRSVPVQAGELVHESPAGFRYLPEYLSLQQAVALDPVQLRLKKGNVPIPKIVGLPFVIQDAKPAGYGQDRLCANAGRDLSAIELLEVGPPDTVGAIEVCEHVEVKLAWRPQPVSALASELDRLEEGSASSRAIRRVNGDAGTSAGGERPKATFEHEGKLWLVKMQDRGDLPCMPAREFVAMSLARRVGLTVPEIALRTHGAHQVFMIERFDRTGDPACPQRRLFASAHAVLQLEPSAVRGDPRRSYLHLADAMRRWGALETQELWKRMVFNALVGNMDDHPRNHGLLHDGHGWRLSPAFDITPMFTVRHGDRPSLFMATGLDGHGEAGLGRFLGVAAHFGLDVEVAAAWLSSAAQTVASQWEPCMREALAPLPGVHDEVVESVRWSFGLASEIASRPHDLAMAVEAAKQARTRRRSNRR